MADLQKQIAEFRRPGMTYRGVPFWAWNGELDKDELIRQVGVLKEMGFSGYFMHSRVGLVTEYLGEEWFDLINAVADAGEKMGMDSWLYDEDRWPSGSAGGKVSENPEYRMKLLFVCDMPAEKYIPSEGNFKVFYGKISEDLVLKEYHELKAGETLPNGPEDRVLVFNVETEPLSNNYNGNCYIDTLKKAATDEFIRVTHEEYKKHCGDRLGKSIKGIFTDEPKRGRFNSDLYVKDGVRRCSIFYTEDIFDEFEKRFGYSALAKLPEIFYKPNGTMVSRVTHDYVDLGQMLFLERFVEPIEKWCDENNMMFTGHALHEDSLIAQTAPQGSLMRFYEHQHIPGIDILTEGNNIYTSNGKPAYFIAKQIQSACRQTGHRRVLSELYGCTGWQFDFMAHKALGDWQAIFGINVRCPHLSWFSMEGENKRDYPASISYQSPYYKDYNIVESYFARFGMLMDTGVPVCDTLVLNPIETIWSIDYMGCSDWILPLGLDIKAIENAYSDFYYTLVGQQIDFDYGDEEMMLRLAKVDTLDGTAVIRIGDMAYRTFVISTAKTIRSSTYELAKKFIEAGGHVLFAGELPEYIDCEPTRKIAELAQMSGAIVTSLDGYEIADALHEISPKYVKVFDENKKTAESICSQVRYDAENDRYIVVMVNTDRKNEYKNLRLRIAGIEGEWYCQEWDMRTGAIYSQDMRRSKCGKLALEFNIAAVGDKAFVLSRTNDNTLKPRPITISRTDFALDIKDIKAKAELSNILVLDSASAVYNGTSISTREVIRLDDAVRDAIGIEHRGGEMLQPWFAKKFAADVYDDVAVTYAFDCDTLPNGEAMLVMERPELWNVSVNGSSISYDAKLGFWVDFALRKVTDIAKYIKLGRNEITISCKFMRTSNIETIYIVGNFGVTTSNGASTMTKECEISGTENILRYNMPFYSGEIDYTIPGDLLKKNCPNGERLVVCLPNFVASLVRVKVEGEPDRAIWTAPYELDITDAAKAGKDVTLVLVASRKNTFGPLHQIPCVNIWTGPDSFRTNGANWSDDYVFYDSKIGDIVLSRRKLNV